MTKRAIRTEDAPDAIGPYSQAVKIGGWLYTAGQIGVDAETGQFVGPDVESQARQVFRNLEAVLAAAGLDFGDVIRTTVFLVDMDDFPRVNAIYGEHFSRPYPARSTVEVRRLPKDARIEVDLVAAGDV